MINHFNANMAISLNERHFFLDFIDKHYLHLSNEMETMLWKLFYKSKNSWSLALDEAFD